MLTFFVLVVLPLTLPLPLPAANLDLMGGIICGGGILLGQGCMSGPRGTPAPRGPIGGTTPGAMPRALGPGKSGSRPLGLDTPVDRGDCGSLCRIKSRGRNTGLIGGILGGMTSGILGMTRGILGGITRGILGGITGGTGLPPKRGGGSGSTSAVGTLGSMRDPLLNGLILFPSKSTAVSYARVPPFALELKSKLSLRFRKTDTM